MKTIIDGADKELLAAHPEGPFESVGEFQAFVDDCFHHLYDDYFRVHMLTWKFEIFEDWECTKPIPLTDADRYTEFIQLVLHGNPPLADRLDDAVTDYLELVGQAGKVDSSGDLRVAARAEGVARSSSAATTNRAQNIKRQPHSDPEALLAGKQRVTYKMAAALLGVTERRVRQLVEDGHLAAQGKGNAKQISVSSIRRRLDLPTNPEEGGNRRK